MSDLPKAKRSKVTTCEIVDDLRDKAKDIAEEARWRLEAAERVTAFVRRIDQWRAEQSIGRSAANEIELHDDEFASRFPCECAAHVIDLLDGTALARVLRALAPESDDVHMVLKRIGAEDDDEGISELMVLLHAVPMTGGVPDAIEKLLTRVTPDYGDEDAKDLDDDDWKDALRALSSALEKEPWWSAFEAFADKE